jgi:hypothetical protein
MKTGRGDEKKFPKKINKKLAIPLTFGIIDIDGKSEEIRGGME